MRYHVLACDYDETLATEAASTTTPWTPSNASRARDGDWSW